MPVYILLQTKVSFCICRENLRYFWLPACYLKFLVFHRSHNFFLLLFKKEIATLWEEYWANFPAQMYKKRPCFSSNTLPMTILPPFPYQNQCSAYIVYVYILLCRYCLLGRCPLLVTPTSAVLRIPWDNGSDFSTHNQRGHKEFLS